MAAITQPSQTLPKSDDSLFSVSANQLTLESSERLSSGISLHTFTASRECLHSFHPSGHIDLLFLEDLDPTRPSKSDAERQLTFTPAFVKQAAETGLHQIMILARNGRVTQLLGLPRLHGPLRAEVVSAGGGFPEDTLKNLEGTVCIASGTGLAPFLAVTSKGYETSAAHLVWTINGNDFGAVDSLLNSELLRPEAWASVKVFVTSGDEVQGLIAGKSMQWWQDKFSNLTNKCGGNVKFSCGRMGRDDVFETASGTPSSVLFCGNKSLEWQVKMWFLNKARVYTTSIQ